LPSDGYFEICSRATDNRGVSQPFAANLWNPEGYGANPIHRIKVWVG
jgi:sulfite oxidase